MAILSDLKAKKISPDDNPLPHGGVVGLSLWPSKTKGRGKWILRYVSPVCQILLKSAPRLWCKSAPPKNDV